MFETTLNVSLRVQDWIVDVQIEGKRRAGPGATHSHLIRLSYSKDATFSFQISDFNGGVTKRLPTLLSVSTKLFGHLKLGTQFTNRKVRLLCFCDKDDTPLTNVKLRTEN